MYKIVDEFSVRGKKVIALDSVREWEDFGAKTILIDDQNYSFVPTHNDYMYVIDITEPLLGKTVRFMK